MKKFKTMTKIVLETNIFSEIEICFDLSRSIDLHKISTAHTNEKAIAGKTSGLIVLNEEVTWEAIHFGIKQKLTSKITGFESPTYFKDEQQKGAFKYFIHEHIFIQKENYVIMKDVFEFDTPFGVFGRIFNHLFLTKHMTKLLKERNVIIKEYAETEKYKTILT
jgi:ligand-binding SRPBCC domain-containing protein